MQKFTTVLEVRTWTTDPKNETHPRYQDICDELSILEVHERELHKHKYYKNVVEFLKDMAEPEKTEAIMRSELHFFSKNKRKPDNMEELYEFLLVLEQEDDAREKAKKKLLVQLGPALGYSAEEVEQKFNDSEIDKDGNCGHNREVFKLMEPTFEYINTLLTWEKV